MTWQYEIIPLDYVDIDLKLPTGNIVIRYNFRDGEHHHRSHCLFPGDNQINIARKVRNDILSIVGADKAIDIDPTHLVLLENGVWIMEYDT